MNIKDIYTRLDTDPKEYALEQILDALEDGETLKKFNFSQEEAEEAHHMINEALKKKA